MEEAFENLKIPIKKRTILQSQQILQSVKRLKFFKDLDKDYDEQTMELICSQFKYKKLEKGQPLFYQGDQGKEFYVILKGQVGIYKHAYKKRSDIVFQKNDKYYEESVNNYKQWMTIDGEVELNLNEQQEKEFEEMDKEQLKQQQKKNENKNIQNNQNSQNTQNTQEQEENSENEDSIEIQENLNKLKKQKSQKQKNQEIVTLNSEEIDHIYKKGQEFRKYVNLLDVLQFAQVKPTRYDKKIQNYIENELFLQQKRQQPYYKKNGRPVPKISKEKNTDINQLLEYMYKRYLNFIVPLNSGIQFGQLALDGVGIRQATVIATETTHLAYLESSAYRELLRDRSKQANEEKVAFFKKISLFDGFKTNDLKDIFTFMNILNIPAGKKVYKTGDIADSFFIIKEGQFEIQKTVEVLDEKQTQYFDQGVKKMKFFKNYHGNTKKDIKLGILGKYQIFGHEELILGKTKQRQTTIVSMSNESQVYICSNIDFQKRIMSQKILVKRLIEQAKNNQILHQNKLKDYENTSQENINYIMQTNFDKKLSFDLKLFKQKNFPSKKKQDLELDQRNNTISPKNSFLQINSNDGFSTNQNQNYLNSQRTSITQMPNFNKNNINSTQNIINQSYNSPQHITSSNNNNNSLSIRKYDQQQRNSVHSTNTQFNKYVKSTGQLQQYQEDNLQFNNFQMQNQKSKIGSWSTFSPQKNKNQILDQEINNIEQLNNNLKGQKHINLHNQVYMKGKNMSQLKNPRGSLDYIEDQHLNKVKSYQISTIQSLNNTVFPQIDQKQNEKSQQNKINNYKKPSISISMTSNNNINKNMSQFDKNNKILQFTSLNTIHNSKMDMSASRQSKQNIIINSLDDELDRGQNSMQSQQQLSQDDTTKNNIIQNNFYVNKNNLSKKNQNKEALSNNDIDLYKNQILLHDFMHDKDIIQKEKFQLKQSKKYVSKNDQYVHLQEKLNYYNSLSNKNSQLTDKLFQDKNIDRNKKKPMQTKQHIFKNFQEGITSLDKNLKDLENFQSGYKANLDPNNPMKQQISNYSELKEKLFKLQQRENMKSHRQFVKRQKDKNRLSMDDVVKNQNIDAFTHQKHLALHNSLNATQKIQHYLQNNKQK